MLSACELQPAGPTREGEEGWWWWGWWGSGTKSVVGVTCQRGREERKSWWWWGGGGTESPPTVLCLPLIPGRFLLCSPHPVLRPAGLNSFYKRPPPHTPNPNPNPTRRQSLKPVNKGCEGCRMEPVLLFDCTWHAVIKWPIHPALPFQ